jgi:hypothetical protein
MFIIKFKTTSSSRKKRLRSKRLARIYPVKSLTPSKPKSSNDNDDNNNITPANAA